jgi:peptidoglycan/LPS O-acetylase OafA/YrhL
VDGFRALAALYVVFVHVLPRAWGDDAPQNRLLALAAKGLSGGHFAVTAFIVVSGFCLMLPVVRAGTVLRGGPTVFFKRRYVRIAPPLYIAFALSALLLQVANLAHPPYYADTRVTATQVIGHLTLLQNLVPGAPLPNNAVLWSITVESVIYLWFPLMVLAWRRLGAARATAAFVALAYVLYPALDRLPILSGLTIQYLGAFALGALAADIAYAPTTTRWGGLRARFPWFPLAGVLGLVVAGACAVLGWPRVYPIIGWFDLPVAVASASLLVGASRPGASLVKRGLEFRPLAAMGAFSYSLYMLHYPLADVLCHFGLASLRRNQNLYAIVAVLVVIPLIIAISYGFYLLFERPFHHLARKVG